MTLQFTQRTYQRQENIPVEELAPIACRVRQRFCAKGSVKFLLNQRFTAITSFDTSCVQQIKNVSVATSHDKKTAISGLTV